MKKRKAPKVRIPHWFWDIFEVCIDVGLPLVATLDFLMNSAGSTPFTRVLQALKDEIIAGGNLSDAMREQATFNQFQVNLVAAGEAGGILNRTILSIAVFEKQLNRMERVRKHFTGARKQKLVTAWFCLETGILLSSGVPILDTFEIVAADLPSMWKNATLAIRQGISEGKTMADSMKEYNIFPPLAIQLISVGEQTGSMDTVLRKVADHYFEDLGLI